MDPHHNRLTRATGTEDSLFERLHPAGRCTLRAMRSVAPYFCALLLGSACKPPPHNTPDASAPDALPLPPRVQLAEPVCRLRSRDFAPRAEVALRLSGSAPPFAVFPAIPGNRDRQAPKLGADLTLPSDEDLPFGLRVLGKGIELSGQVSRDIPIHAVVPFSLGKFIAALPSTPLQVIRATQAEVVVETKLGPSIEVLADPVQSRGPCKIFGLDEANFNAASVIPGVVWKETPDALLKPGRPIGVTVLPVGDPVVRLKPGPNDNRAVVVFETDKQNGRKHIGWLGSTVLVHGWVDGSDLTPLPKTSEALSQAAPAVPKPEPRAAGATTKCANEVPIAARLHEARALVGAIGDDVPFETLEKADGWVEIRPRIAPLRLTEGAQLLVRESDLKACTRGGL